MKKLLVWIGLILLLVPICVSAKDLFSEEVRNANVLNKIKAWTSLNSNEVFGRGSSRRLQGCSGKLGISDYQRHR